VLFVAANNISNNELLMKGQYEIAKGLVKPKGENK